MTTPAVSSGAIDRPYLQSPEDVAAALGTSVDVGLTSAEAASRLATYGPNHIEGEKPPSPVAIALTQLRDPMNLMLIAVAIVSFLIAEWSTGVVVALLVVLNVGLGTNQELKARASVDALSKLQVPQARVVRDGSVAMIDADDIVPGDVVQVEAGDIVPADGRIVRSATCETQEAALTGESAPIAKDANTLPGPDVALGDRSNMLFQNTSVTRGTATVVITATGMSTQMGQIATMLSSVTRTKSPLQRELGSLTRIIGAIAWLAVAIIVVVGLVRHQPLTEVLLLGVAMAIAAIPTGMPMFVSVLLSQGAKALAASKAIVKNLTDVETLGATSAINTDKTGTLTMNEMMVSSLYFAGNWFSVEGEGYRKSGQLRCAAGLETPDFTRLALGLALCSDATVSDDGTVVGDPTEAALVVLAAKIGVDAEETRRAYPRLGEVPFDSDYKFMATIHQVHLEGEDHLVLLVKGAPDVIIARSATVGTKMAGTPVPIAEGGQALADANERLGSQGLRVLAFAARLLDESDLATAQSDPMSLVHDLAFVGLVGIIDPLRPSSKAAVDIAHKAGIDVRMITGDHAVTAEAIGRDLQLGPGAISGAELAALSDDELKAKMPELHVFGRVTPDDKLRLARIMQEQGLIVAMTGDAVNDAAALKQADIGVAMGTGSEVTKQAARMILTDDNFGTLVHAVELGRITYDKVVSYVRVQMTQLISLIVLFLAATAFNVNGGVALTPTMVLFVGLFVIVFPVLVVAGDPGAPDIMTRPPRDPKVPIANGAAVSRWIVYGAVRFFAAFACLAWGPDAASTDAPSASMTMCFVVMALASVAGGLVLRRDPASGLTAPVMRALKILAIPVVIVVLGTELGFLQKFLMTQSLSVGQWTVVLLLVVATAAVPEVDKAIRRARAPRVSADVTDVHDVVEPARARALTGGAR
jgi:Ca2+-transporting ATPase